MSKGIYKYTDLETGEVVYVGKDSHIDKNQRHNAHLNPKKYNLQRFNRVLQNNPDRYEYGVIWETEDCTTLKLNKMEILFGKIYNPKFNFGKFGKGGLNSHTDEAKQKISKNNARYWKDKNFSDEHKRKISESKKGCTGYWKDKNLSEEHSLNMSKSQNTTGYFRVYIRKCKRLKQGFNWVYQYNENGKKKSISSINIEELKEKVKAKGLEWREI